jgi:DNA-binding IclR family transcriptional regulator
MQITEILTPEELLKLEISALMQRFKIEPSRVYELLSEMKEFQIDTSWQNWQDDF